MTRREQFVKKCDSASLKCGIRFILYYDDGPDSPDDVFREDGSLHVRREGYRARFDIGHNIGQRGRWPDSPSSETLGAAEQNAKARSILETLDMQHWITARVLVEEETTG